MSKDSLRIEICGTLDELGSFLGISKSLIKESRKKKLIESIQRDLFLIGAEVATRAGYARNLKRRINRNQVSFLEENSKKLERKMKLDKFTFVIMGHDTISSILDVTRAIARRLERRVVTLKKKKLLKNNYILVYLNRLSDFLYLLARSFEKKRHFTS